MRINLTKAIEQFMIGSIVYLCGVLVMVFIFAVSLLVALTIFDVLILIIKSLF